MKKLLALLLLFGIVGCEQESSANSSKANPMASVKFEGVCKIDELFEQLNGVETNVRDNMFSKLKEFILYGEEAENNQSDFPVLKENSYSNLSSEIDGVYTNEFWDEEYLYITQESFWPLSLRFSD